MSGQGSRPATYSISTFLKQKVQQGSKNVLVRSKIAAERGLPNTPRRPGRGDNTAPSRACFKWCDCTPAQILDRTPWACSPLQIFTPRNELTIPLTGALHCGRLLDIEKLIAQFLRPGETRRAARDHPTELSIRSDQS